MSQHIQNLSQPAAAQRATTILEWASPNGVVIPPAIIRSGPQARQTTSAHLGLPAASATTLRTPSVSATANRVARYDATVDSPAFVVRDHFVACIICGVKSIGFDVQTHASGKKHQKRLCGYTATDAAQGRAAGALNLSDAIAAAGALEMSSQNRKRKRSRAEECQE